LKPTARNSEVKLNTVVRAMALASKTVTPFDNEKLCIGAKLGFARKAKESAFNHNKALRERL